MAQSMEQQVAARWAIWALGHCSFLACVLVSFSVCLKLQMSSGSVGKLRTRYHSFCFWIIVGSFVLEGPFWYVDVFV